MVTIKILPNYLALPLLHLVIDISVAMIRHFKKQYPSMTKRYHSIIGVSKNQRTPEKNMCRTMDCVQKSFSI